MKRHITLLLFAIVALALAAQQPRKVTRRWFADPDVSIATPAFTTGRYYTSYKRMLAYLDSEAAAHPGLVRVETVGTTQKGRNIPLVSISDGKSSPSKLRVLYVGSLHGNEHAGTEGLMWLVHQLTADTEVSRLLDDIDFYILPMLNVDGSEADSRYTHNGTDPNRDQTRLSTPEAQCLHSVASRVMPHVFVDFHEFKPLRTAYEDLSPRLISNPFDFMFLYSSNPNVYQGLTRLVEEAFIPEAQHMAQQWGLQNTTYFTTKTEGGRTVMNIGGQSARSSSNIMALRGCVSLLMEVRGVGLGRTSYLRRVNTVYQLSLSYAATAVRHADALRQAVAEAATQQTPIATDYKVPLEKSHPFEFIDLLRNEKVTLPVDAHPARQLEVKRSVARPKAYVIAATEELAIALVEKFGITFRRLEAAETLPLEAYRVTAARTQKAEVLGIRPVSVSVETEAASVALPAGSIVIPMDQPLATLAAILLEPECSNGFVNFRVVEAKAGDTLPIYRVK